MLKRSLGRGDGIPMPKEKKRGGGAPQKAPLAKIDELPITS